MDPVGPPPRHLRSEKRGPFGQWQHDAAAILDYRGPFGQLHADTAAARAGDGSVHHGEGYQYPRPGPPQQVSARLV